MAKTGPKPQDKAAGGATPDEDGVSAEQEARFLAEEAVEAMQHGDREEGRFLAGEARALDPKAAEAVLKDQDKTAKA